MLSSQSVSAAFACETEIHQDRAAGCFTEIAESAMNDLGKTNPRKRGDKKALQFLMQVKDAVNVSWVYAESGCNLADLQELEERELIRLLETEILRDPLEKTR